MKGDKGSPFGGGRVKELRQRVAELERIAYGPYKPAVRGVPSIDHFEIASKRVVIEEDTHYRIEVELAIRSTPQSDAMMHDLFSGEGICSYEGRCLKVVGIETTHDMIQGMTVVKFRQVNLSSAPSYLYGYREQKDNRYR